MATIIRTLDWRAFVLAMLAPTVLGA